MHKDQYDINENEKPKSYEILRQKTDLENKVVEPFKPRKKQLHQLFYNIKKNNKKKSKK